MKIEPLFIWTYAKSPEFKSEQLPTSGVQKYPGGIRIRAFAHTTSEDDGIEATFAEVLNGLRSHPNAALALRDALKVSWQRARCVCREPYAAMCNHVRVKSDSLLKGLNFEAHGVRVWTHGIKDVLVMAVVMLWYILLYVMRSHLRVYCQRSVGISRTCIFLRVRSYICKYPGYTPVGMRCPACTKPVWSVEMSLLIACMCVHMCIHLRARVCVCICLIVYHITYLRICRHNY